MSDEAAEQNYKRLDKATQDKDADAMGCMRLCMRCLAVLEYTNYRRKRIWHKN